MFEKKGTYYGGESSALDLFKPAFATDKVRAVKLAFWLRDARGGAGNRSGFRSCIKWLAENDSEWIEANLNLVPECGRWDDLITFVDTPVEDAAIAFWARAIADTDNSACALACKWAPREKKNKVVFAKLRKALRMSPKDFRKHLARYTNVVETAMCSGDWYSIDYNTVPSVAMARNAQAFLKHDSARYDSWRESLTDENSDNKVNASALFPHDVWRTSQRDAKLANAQFASLPNYMEETNDRIMPIADFSGSMCCTASGEVTCMAVAQSLALYCSDRVGSDNPFYRKYMPFSGTAKFISWGNKTFTQASREMNCGGYYGPTNIKSALDKILESAKFFNLTNDQIPTCLLILSDMQFDGGASNGDQTVVEKAMNRWEAEGYSRPRIVYWNLAGYAGSPARGTHENVALVSGFSPSILGSILGGTDFSPMAVLDRAIEKYEIVIPEEVTA